jgi:hypothetical protein
MGGSGPRNWDSPPLRDPCTTLAFRATLNSPQPTVIAMLSTGNILAIFLSVSPQNVVQVLHGSLVAGSLTGSKISSLINCIRNGHTFEAEVHSIAGGQCVVDVRPV